MKKLTVLVPCYNFSKYLPDCIRSIYNQKTNFDFDVIIRDDGSTDNTKYVLENLKIKFPNLIILDGTKNLGAFGNIKLLHESSNSEYIAYLDGDDMFGDEDKLQKQVDFGPRVTASEASKKCAKWISSEFEKYGATVTEQKGTVTNWDKKKYEIINIIAQINPKASKRILITAHWDSRPYADNDPIEANKNKPVLAADDGASGIGVMLEMARVIQASNLNIGVDFMCFDSEDL
jgi:glycosyltransferase involved in cell wall biosynthesis